MIKHLVVYLIIFYQRFISPLTRPSCRFFPSCSSYTLQALDKHGLVKGLYLSLRRICRCHPWHPGGYDPV